MLAFAQISTPAVVHRYCGLVDDTAIHSTRCSLNAHPDEIVIQFWDVGCVIELVACITDTKGLCYGASKAVIFEHQSGTASFNKFDNSIDFRGGVPIICCDGDEAIFIELWQGECVTFNSGNDVGGVAWIFDVRKQQRAADQGTGLDSSVFEVRSECRHIVPIVIIC